MASRVAEVIYRLRDVFTAPVARVTDAYGRLRAASRDTSAGIERDNRRIANSLDALAGGYRRVRNFIATIAAARGTARTVTDIADELDRLGKTAARLNIDPGLLSAYGFAAERSGVAVATLEKALQDLQRRTGEAALGLGEARIAFETLGIDAQAFVALGLEDQVYQLADAFATVADEETKAALASKIFGESGVQVLNTIAGGSEALRTLIEQAREFNNVTRAQTDAAAVYNDALRTIEEGINGLKVRALTPLLEFFGRGLSTRGFGDPVEGLRNELALLEEQVERPFLSRLFGFRGTDTRTSMYFRIQELREALAALDEQQARSEVATERATAARAEQAKADGLYRVEVDNLTNSYRRQVTEQRAVLNEQTAELRAARSQQAAIEREFKGLVDEITSPGPLENVTLLDVFVKIREAATAAAGGQADEAIAKARTGGDLLTRLKDKGTETQGTLRFLAEQLQRIASEAAGQRAELELLDVEQAQGALDDLSNKLGALQADAVKQGQAAGRAFVDALQIEINNAQITLPPLNADLPPVVAAGIESYRRQIEQRGAK